MIPRTRLPAKLVILSGLAIAGLCTSPPAHAGRAAPSVVAALRLQVDRPIIHLGERVHVSGDHFTPNARIAISLHGPMSATLGAGTAQSRADSQGHFRAELTIARYPDAAARQWHTVVIAVMSTASQAGAHEGAAVAVQADPMPGLDIVTKAALTRTSLTIDGTAVPAFVVGRDTTLYHVSLAGHLRAGRYIAYLKWSDAKGDWGARSWSFRIGSPYAVAVAPVLHLSAQRLHLGSELGIGGSGFTPGASVAVALGGPNAAPGAAVATTTADNWGDFFVRVRIARYPDTNAQATHAVYISAGASGAAVGDLPEGAAVPVQVF